MSILPALTSPIYIVTATRSNQDDFYNKTALGRSLKSCYLDSQSLRILVALENTAGLPAVYNAALQEDGVTDDSIFVFVHDDIHLVDFFWPERLVAALDEFGIVGLAGNRRRLPGQISWAFVDHRGTWDHQDNLSGRIGHGSAFPCTLDRFGVVPQECKLLDGLFLAARKGTLDRYGIRFDDRFAFHFYDLDFCRQAESVGIRMGTAAISVIHESFGSYNNDGWIAGYHAYLEKWGE